MERSFRFPATADAPRLARHELDGWLNDLLGPDRADDVRLLTTELITNAIRHGGVRGDDDITLDVEASGASVTIAVTQPTSPDGARMRLGDVEAPETGGFGLQLVDRLANEWGVDRGTPGSVWFGVLRSPAS